MTTGTVGQQDAVELGLWIRLLQTEGVGAESARRLLSAFGMPSCIFSRSFDELSAVVPARLAAALHKPLPAMAHNRVARTLAWAEQPGHHVLTLGDADYPQALLTIADPPILLYAIGRCALLNGVALAIVGSRNATEQGIQNAARLASAVSCAGLTIVSGMALGIDAAAHLGGLRGGGSSVAVIGTGIDIAYPARNRALAQRLGEEGCIISEYPLGMPPIAANFPRRNRIISGLARAVLVIEAAGQSGSLITARMAAEQGRDVFAVPGSIHAPLSKGCHQLIKQGAKLVESAQDILEEIGRTPAMRMAATAQAALPLSTPSSAAQQSAADKCLLDAIGYDPVDPDTLSARCGLSAEVLTGQMLMLELDGVIECLPGGRYRRVA